MHLRSIGTMLPALALTLGLATAPLGATDAELLRLSRSDVNFMLGIRVRDVAASPLVKTMLDGALESKPEWGALLAMAGENPLEGFDEVLFAANIDSESPQDPKNALILLSGAFGQGRLDTLFCSSDCDREQYRNLEMIKVERKDADTPGYLVVLNERYAVLGERPAVLAAIDRHVNRTAAAISPEMQTWIDRLGRYHLWLAAKGPFQTPASEEPGPAMMAADAASKMEGFGLGLLLESDVSLSVELESVSDADAKQLYETVQGLLALGRMHQQREEPAGEPGAFELLENLKLSNAGRLVSASLTIPQKELTRQVRAKLEQSGADEPRLEAGLRGEQQREPSVRVSRRKPSSGAIRVYGLEPRAVEYPLTPR